MLWTASIAICKKYQNIWVHVLILYILEARSEVSSASTAESGVSDQNNP